MEVSIFLKKRAKKILITYNVEELLMIFSGVFRNYFRRGLTDGEHVEREPVRGSGGGAPNGIQGSLVGGGQWAKPPEAEDIFIMNIVQQVAY